MFTFQLKSFRSESNISEPHFFILCKGLNSGKPLSEPCPNCFICICQSEQEKENLYWILFALWQGRRFHQVCAVRLFPLFARRNFPASSTRGRTMLSISRKNSVKMSKPCNCSNKRKKNMPNFLNPSKN